jgi:putative ABC transport system ATP-binding protein
MVADLMFDLLAQAGAALVLVTHDEALARRADRIVRMADGLIVSSQPEAAA